MSEESAHESPAWSAPRRLCNGILLNKPTVLSTGEWLLPASVWERSANLSTPPEFRHDLGSENGANVHVSRNRGATWSFLGQAHVAERVFDEHMIVERRDGSPGGDGIRGAPGRECWSTRPAGSTIRSQKESNHVSPPYPPITLYPQ